MNVENLQLKEKNNENLMQEGGKDDILNIISEDKFGNYLNGIKDDSYEIEKINLNNQPIKYENINYIKEMVNKLPKTYLDNQSKTAIEISQKDIINKRKNIEMKLNNLVDNQYNLWGHSNNNLDIFQNTKANFADNRFNSNMRIIDIYRKNINSIGNEYNIPPEIIGSIILKEQYTQKYPDEVVNAGSYLGDKLSVYKNKDTYDGSILGIHSVGLGAIQPTTARKAWQWYYGKDYTDKYLPKSNWELQKELTNNKDFNIENIAIVLLYKAFLCGYDNVSTLSNEQWHDVLALYNGVGEKAQQYSEYTMQYVPYMKEYLKW